MAINAELVAGMDLSDVSTGARIGPVTPGEVLREEFVEPLGLSGHALARELGVPSHRVTQILAGERSNHRRDGDSARPAIRHVGRKQ